ncbi:hypothetical protein HNQ77_002165 [Silvibacterium bohemicum]|uniref:Uncharacterized protein n=1 Tax=Silvibacterium bohemicum TaxID=1577686 RepID=A0A841JS29_9BACT|nr:hypothetical protein [Silvibacterium bohemicum]MBB6144213.1 hypothetical protein [Silvibacterium bohemicum]
MNQALFNAQPKLNTIDPLSGANGEIGSIPLQSKPFVVPSNAETKASGSSVITPVVVHVPQLDLLNVLRGTHEVVELPRPRKESRHKNSSDEKGARPSEGGGTLRVMRALRACVEAISMRVAS